MRVQKLLGAALVLMSAAANATIVDGERQRPTFATLSQGFETNVEAYLYNVGAGLFFTEGNAYNTQASVGEKGLRVKFTESNGAYVLNDYSNTRSGWYATFINNETQLFVDRASQANYFFSVTDNGNGTFRLSASSVNPTYNYVEGELFVGVPTTGNTTALHPFLDESEGYVDWALVTKENYDGLSAAINVYNKAQELKAIIDNIKELNGDASSLEAVYLNEEASIEELQEAIDGSKKIYVEALISGASDKENVDVTILLNNPDYEQSSLDEQKTKGWTVEAVSGGNVRTGGTNTNICYEAWNNASFDIHQELTDLPVGVYEIQVQGFYRYLRGNNAWNAYRAQESEYVKKGGVPVYIYLNNNATPFVNVFDEPVARGTLYSASTSYGNPYTDPNGQYWYPNEMYNSAVAFENGMYKQSAYGLVSDDHEVVRVGVKGASNQGNDSWVIWDNFRLIYRGFKPDVVQPILETAMEDVEEYIGMLMGKSEYGTLTQALSDAKAAIEAQDGEAMFNLLNTLYEAKDPARISKDIFLEQDVAADTLRLADAIRDVEGKKLSKATLVAANELLTGIKNNLLYENNQTDLLKADVTAAIDALYRSVALYEQLGSAISSLEANVKKKANQTVIDEAVAVLTPAKTAFEEASLADNLVESKVKEINDKATALNNSVQLYAQLAEAMTKLDAAIKEVSGETEHVSKSTLRMALLQQQSITKFYDEGAIADENIPARITSIDNIIENLTKSVRLYKEFAAALEELKAELAKEDKVAASTLEAAQAIYQEASAAYEEGSIDDDQIEAQVAQLKVQVEALAKSAQLYKQLGELIPSLESAAEKKAMQSLIFEATSLLQDIKIGFEEASIEDDVASKFIEDIPALVSNINASARLYAQLSEAINRLDTAIEEVSDETQHVSKSTLRMAELQQKSVKQAYEGGTIDDENIPARITSIDNIIENLTKSVRLYKEFAAALEELKEALDKEDMVAASTLEAARDTYETANAAYEEGSIDDDQIEAQVEQLKKQVEALAASARLYKQLAAAIEKEASTFENVVGYISEELKASVQKHLNASKKDYEEGHVADSDVPAAIDKINNLVANLNAVPDVEEATEEAASTLAERANALARVRRRLADAQHQTEVSYLTAESREQIESQMGTYETQLNSLATELSTHQSNITTALGNLAELVSEPTTLRTGEITQAKTSSQAARLWATSGIALINEVDAYIDVEPAQSIAAAATVVELTADYGTFCSTANLDFTEVEGLKAYIASAFVPAEEKVVLTRVYNVPAGTGIVVIGTAGESYDIALGDGSAVLSNLLVGAPVSIELPATEGQNTNCILADGQAGIGFYPTAGGTLAAGKAYLPLPTTSLQAQKDVKGIHVVFDDATVIHSTYAENNDDKWYTLDGRMLQHKPNTSGVYVKGLRKVVVKQ